MARAHHHTSADGVARTGALRPSADMNLTPLIDVLLVLLIIFMAALPLTQKGLDATLPSETQPAALPKAIIDRILVEYTADRRLTINHQDVVPRELEERLRGIYRERSDKTIFIAGDGALRYGDIVGIIDAAKGAGVQRVGIVTEAMRRAGGHQ